MDDPKSEVETSEEEEDFLTFLKERAKIEDADTHRPVIFKPWGHQEQTARELAAGQWLLILKARQLGFTWLLAAYAVWITRKPGRRVLVFYQDKEYASDFLDRCRFINDQLRGLRSQKATTDNRTRLEFDEDHKGSYIRALAATKRAAHSISANLLICDEAAYIEQLKQILRAAKPTLETEGGQAVVLSTSNGPSGHFWELWNNAIGSSGDRAIEPSNGNATAVSSPDHPITRSPDLRTFKPLFFRWDARPGRTREWYNREGINNAHDPSYMKREYPHFPEEAFEAAEGRVYPLFSDVGEMGKKFVRSISILPTWKHYRGIDFGAVDPFVCLWACVVPGEPPGLTIDPRCTNTIRELLSYRYNDKSYPRDEDNHAPDALRYLIISAPSQGLTGHVHVYRELYVEKSVDHGLSVIDLAQRIGVMSGGQRFVGTYADRSRPDSILILQRQGIPTKSARALSGGRGSEIAQGIVRVNNLINATATSGEKTAAPPAPKPPKPPPRMDFTVREARPAVFA